MFKVKGIERLVSYEELVRMKMKYNINKVRIVDLRSQKNWVTDLRTIIEKFG
jgi:ATP-dependent RNA circularization protein (DNA/RNA ligase family)